MPLTPAEKRDAQQIFAEGRACEYCGGIHQRACGRVRRVERHPNGNITAVEFFSEWDDTGVIWPEDAFDPDDEDGADER